MASSYPGAVDALTNPISTDAMNSVSVPHATQHADVNDALEAIQTELGTDPAGASATVKARLDTLDTTVGGKAATAHSHAQADVTSLVADLALKSPLASPTFTGTPAAPTATQADNSTKLATTAYVDTALAGKVPSAWATKSSGYTAAPGDHVLDVTGTTTITLPAAASSTGKVFVIRNTGGGAVTIDGNGAELVGGAATQAFTGYGYLRIVCNGTAWLVLDGAYWDESVGRREYVWNDAYNSAAGGWQMVYGDTGWRDVTASLNADWAISAAVPICRLRRVGGSGFLDARFKRVTNSGLKLSGSTVFTLPAGFQRNDAYTPWGIARDPSSSSFGVVVANASTEDMTLFFPSGTWATNDEVSFSATWSLVEPWPTVLPGTALGTIPYN